MNRIEISASILSADFSRLEKEVKKLEESGIDRLHFDVMDGHFVPNITFGSTFIKSLRNKTNLFFEVHLMIANPQYFLNQFVDCGSDCIIVHAEAVTHLDRLISQIKSTGVKVGVSIVPSTSEEILRYIIKELDLVLIMTVNPGFSGQHFIDSQLKKVIKTQQLIKETKSKAVIAVDGGINEITAPYCIKAGAQVLISGQYIFSTNNYEKNISNLR